MNMSQFWILIIATTLSFLLTGLLRRYALAKSLMDVPNNRSSHSTPTPRGGGVSIVITFLAGLLYLWFIHLVSTDFLFALFGAGAIIAIIGFIDDHGHIAARWRLLGHFTSAIWLVFWLGGLPVLTIFGESFNLTWIGDVLLIIGLVWFLNLYNFMDGIDGIASVEALSSTLIVILLFLFVFNHEDIVSLNIIMFAAVAGFLMWNFPPAKIFMGDAGSGFLGLMLGAIALSSLHIAYQMLWVWLILLGVFIVDATYTLLRRLMRGEKIYEAHRSHAYQYASRKYSSHLPVTLGVLFINISWLAPWSYVVAIDVVGGVVGVLCAYLPLLWLAWYFRAGEEEANS